MTGRGTSTLGLALAGCFLAAFLAFAPAAIAAPDEVVAPPCAAPASPCAAPTCGLNCDGNCDLYPCCDCKQPQEPKCPPKFHNLRFLEDWSPCLCVPCDPCDPWWRKIKAVRIARNGGIWANFGGQIRFRFEAFSDLGFGANPDPNQHWVLGRVRAHADVHFGRNFRLFVEGIYADQWDERNPAARPIDVNEGDVLNLFVEGQHQFASGWTAGLWAGRRELQLAKQRLVSPLDWANTRRTFQGGGGWAKRGPHKVEVFATRPVNVIRDAIDDEWNEDRLFWGADYTNTSLTCLTWGAYALGLHDSRTVTQNPQDRYTIGARLDGKIPDTRLDLDVEAAYQFGDSNGTDIRAYMISASLGWKPRVRCLDPRFAIGVDYASGDENPADTKAGTFNQLFPLGHKYFGHADLIGRQNLTAVRLEGSIKPTDNLTLSVWWHAFGRAEEADAAYNAAGGVLRAVPAGGLADTGVGSEIDLMVHYKIDRNWTAAIEYAHFFTGSYIKNTGPDEDIDFWWIGLTGTF